MRMTTDVVVSGGGEFLAALRPVVGRDKVVRFYTKTNERRGPSARLDVCMLNGLPVLMIEFTDNAPREASRMVMRCDLDSDGAGSRCCIPSWLRTNCWLCAS